MGYSPRGRRESDMTEHTHAHTHTSHTKVPLCVLFSALRRYCSNAKG